jgi:hypothetical protein
MKESEARSFSKALRAWLDADGQNLNRLIEYAFHRATSGHFGFFNLIVDLVDGPIDPESAPVRIFPAVSVHGSTVTNVIEGARIQSGQCRVGSFAPNGLGVVGPKRATQQSVLIAGLHNLATQPGLGPRIGGPLRGGAPGVGIIVPSCPDRAMRSLLTMRDSRSHSPGEFERGQSRQVDI